MGKYLVVYSSQAIKDAKKIKDSNYHQKAQNIFEKLQENPFIPPFESLIGDLKEKYSKRINIQHRIIYEVLENIENEVDPHGTVYEGIVKILRMWTHYE